MEFPIQNLEARSPTLAAVFCAHLVDKPKVGGKMVDVGDSIRLCFAPATLPKPNEEVSWF